MTPNPCHYLTLNIAETVEDTDVVTMERYNALLNCVISNDLAKYSVTRSIAHHVCNS